MTHKATRLSALRRHTGRVQRQLNHHKQQSHTLTAIRLTTFLLTFLLTSAAFFLSGPTLALPVGLIGLTTFIIAVTRHRHLETTINRHTLWLQIKQSHIARLTLDWANLPPPSDPQAPVPATHPFALDLDLFGSHSLHQLINTTVSPEGDQRLRTWLLDPNPQPHTITQRQNRIRQLAHMPRFRDKLTLASRLTADTQAKTQLLDWLNQPTPTPPPQRLWQAFALLATLNLLLFASHQFGLLPRWWPYTVGLYLVLYFFSGREASHTFKTGLTMQAALNQLNTVFHFLETYRYGKNHHITTLTAPFLDPHNRPSHHFRQLSHIVNAAGLSQNPVMWLLLNIALPWDLYFAHRLHQIRHNLAQNLPAWLDIWFELEALNALATLHYLNPHHTFPTFSEDQTLLTGQQLGHPLITDSHKVTNDFTIDQLGTVNILTGSNMSGKSSFLRTLGINLCLAYAGGSVNATQFNTHWFRLFTSIHITDSVTDGISFFYAEVKRLRALLDTLNSPGRPVFFLIDEIFRGTNNQERLLGSRAFITALVGGHSLGAIATHDLELVKLAHEFPAISNYHFRDDIDGQKMIFDYTLRPGPCPTTNALKIMAAAGLPIPKK